MPDSIAFTFKSLTYDPNTKNTESKKAPNAKTAISKGFLSFIILLIY